jgi:gas vesicle structural protein
MPEPANNLVIATPDQEDEFTLLELLDHVLTTGVVIRGSLVISLAGVDLVYLGLDVILTSVETALRQLPAGSALAGALSARAPRKSKSGRV